MNILESKTYKTKKRWFDIYKMRKSGETLKKIGQIFNVSKERIRQICIYGENIEKRYLAITSFKYKVPNLSYNELLNSGIDNLLINVRTYNCLKKLNLETIKDIVDKDKYFFLRAKNFGKKSLEDLTRELSNINLILKDECNCPLCGTNLKEKITP